MGSNPTPSAMLCDRDRIFGVAMRTAAFLHDPGSRTPVRMLRGLRIGSIYYLCYAGSHIEFTNEAQLWSLIALVILMSTILHGFSVGWAMDRLKEE